MDLNDWPAQIAGSSCQLCGSRAMVRSFGSQEIAKLQVSTLYLFADQRFRGYCVLIFDPYHAVSIDQLEQADYTSLMTDLRRSGRAIRAALSPDHINYECLGNSAPHIHWHIVPRRLDDPRWGRPIWGGWPRQEFATNTARIPEEEMALLARRIRDSIETGT